MRRPITSPSFISTITRPRRWILRFLRRCFHGCAMNTATPRAFTHWASERQPPSISQGSRLRRSLIALRVSSFSQAAAQIPSTQRSSQRRQSIPIKRISLRLPWSISPPPDASCASTSRGGATKSRGCRWTVSEGSIWRSSKRAIRPDTALVTLLWANNETGVLSRFARSPVSPMTGRLPCTWMRCRPSASFPSP